MEVTEVKRVRSKMHLTIGSERIVIPATLYRERPLEIGDEIDLEEYDHWLLLHQYRPALEYAVSLLAARAYATRELESKLLRLGYRPATVEMVLYKLTSNNLMDDADFARQWAQSRANRSLGRTRIAQELRRKGVSAEDAAAALDSLDPEEQQESADALVAKALRRAKAGEDPRKTAQRITAMLARRGFSYDQAREAIRRAMSDVDEDE